MTGGHREEPFDSTSQHDASQFHDYLFCFFFFLTNMATCTSRLSLRSSSFHHIPPHYISTNLIQLYCDIGLYADDVIPHWYDCRLCGESCEKLPHIPPALCKLHSWMSDLPWMCSSEIVHISTVRGLNAAMLSESISLYIYILTFWLAHLQMSLLDSLFVKQRQKIIFLHRHGAAFAMLWPWRMFESLPHHKGSRCCLSLSAVLDWQSLDTCVWFNCLLFHPNVWNAYYILFSVSYS